MPTKPTLSELLDQYQSEYTHSLKQKAYLKKQAQVQYAQYPQTPPLPQTPMPSQTTVTTPPDKHELNINQGVKDNLVKLLNNPDLKIITMIAHTKLSENLMPEYVYLITSGLVYKIPTDKYLQTLIPLTSKEFVLKNHDYSNI